MTSSSTNDWFFSKGTLARDSWETVVDEKVDGWQYTGLRVAELNNSSVSFDGNIVERIVVPLAGAFTVTYQLAGDAEQLVQKLAGRNSVFSGPTDTLYLPTGTSGSITGTGRVAVAEAPTTEHFPVKYTAVADVPVEMRGAGKSSRQVQNFGTPAALEAARLIVCEVITPAENWSSYPPHKHDQFVPGHEAHLEEIYYFETAVAKGVTAPSEAEPFGYMRTYESPAGPIDTLAEVRSGDVALVPHGWHGPCVAAPGYDMYYLNVMAGPDPERIWLISEDPAHTWVRDTWAEQVVDPRLPYTA